MTRAPSLPGAHRTRAVAIAVALTVAIGAPAQAPSPWAVLPVPGGVNPNQLDSLGKLITYHDGSALHLYSSVARSWHTLPVAPGSSLRITNDCAIVRDGALWTAFASFTDRLETLQLSPQALLLNPQSQENDSIMLVLDGRRLHAWSGFRGRWITRTVSPGMQWSVQRHTALLADGTLLSGMDAYTGQWHDIAVSAPVTMLSADGMAGIAVSGIDVHGFSAAHGTWSMATMPPGAVFERNDDWALLRSSQQMLGFSGLTGEFAVHAVGSSAVAKGEDLFAIADTPIGLVAFSAITGTFSVPIAPSTATLAGNVAVALAADGPVVSGYSAVLNTASTIVITAGGSGAAGTVAYVADATADRLAFFSAFSGEWYAAPADVLTGQPVLTTTTALLATATGARAFSARTGAFVPLTGKELVLSGNPSSAIGHAANQDALFAFDARTDRWIHAARAGTGPLFLQNWRTTLLVVDGSTAFGFGAQDGSWSTTLLPGAFSSHRTNSESGHVVTVNHLLAYSPLPELVPFAQFPAFRRVQPANAPVRLLLSLPIGGFAVLGVSPANVNPITVPGLGLLLLDPTAMVTALMLPAAVGEPAEAVLTMPAVPSLRGAQLACQALVLPASGPLRFTQPCTVFLL